MCSARGGCWLLRHSGLLLPMGNTGMSSAEWEFGSWGAGAGAWAAFARNQYKDCYEVEEEGQEMD